MEVTLLWWSSQPGGEVTASHGAGVLLELRNCFRPQSALHTSLLPRALLCQ